MRAYACTYTRVRSVAILGHFLYILSHFERLTLIFVSHTSKGVNFGHTSGPKLKEKNNFIGSIKIVDLSSQNWTYLGFQGSPYLKSSLKLD